MDIQGTIISIREWWAGLDLERWFGESSSDAVQVAVFFVSFFAVGFLFKKYLKFIFMVLVVSFFMIKGLEYYKILDIDWEAFNTFMGLDPAATFGSVTALALEWVKSHLVVSISSAAGFLIGYKLA